MKKYILVTLMLSSYLLVISINGNGLKKESESEKDTIRKVFSDWQLNEIKAHHFCAKDSCNWDYMNNHEFNGTIPEMFGFPDSIEIKFSFADLNQDGHLDGLVIFTPKQCDGGNASMWDQYQIIIVSNKDRYKVKEDFSAGTSLAIGSTDKGFYWLDSIAPNQLLGTYYQFKEGDGRCCPSIEKRIVISFDTKKMKFLKNKKQQ